jgi:hypothetical protein
MGAISSQGASPSIGQDLGHVIFAGLQLQPPKVLHKVQYGTVDKALNVNRFHCAGVPVPRFFFDPCDGQFLARDEQGQELAGPGGGYGP